MKMLNQEKEFETIEKDEKSAGFFFDKRRRRNNQKIIFVATFSLFFRFSFNFIIFLAVSYQFFSRVIVWMFNFEFGRMQSSFQRLLWREWQGPRERMGPFSVISMCHPPTGQNGGHNYRVFAQNPARKKEGTYRFVKEQSQVFPFTVAFQPKFFFFFLCEQFKANGRKVHKVFHLPLHHSKIHSFLWLLIMMMMSSHRIGWHWKEKNKGRPELEKRVNVF